VVQDEDDVTLITTEGIVLRMKVANIGSSGRATRGFKLMDVTSGSMIATVARIAAADLKKSEVAVVEVGNQQAKLF